MRIAICAANLTDCPLPSNLPFIGVDKGAQKLMERGITPAFAIGDFDSIGDVSVLEKATSVKTLPERKDVTDTHAAVDWALKNGYDEIDIYGATGGRLDHFIAVLVLLELYSPADIRIIDSQNEISLLKPGINRFSPGEYKYFSLYAPDLAVISISGAEYELTDYRLERKDPLCCSNQAKEDIVTVSTSAALYLVKSKDKS